MSKVVGNKNKKVGSKTDPALKDPQIKRLLVRNGVEKITSPKETCDVVREVNSDVIDKLAHAVCVIAKFRKNKIILVGDVESAIQVLGAPKESVVYN